MLGSSDKASHIKVLWQEEDFINLSQTATSNGDNTPTSLKFWQLSGISVRRDNSIIRQECENSVFVKPAQRFWNCQHDSRSSVFGLRLNSFRTVTDAVHDRNIYKVLLGFVTLRGLGTFLVLLLLSLVARCLGVTRKYETETSHEFDWCQNSFHNLQKHQFCVNLQRL